MALGEGTNSEDEDEDEDNEELYAAGAMTGVTRLKKIWHFYNKPEAKMLMAACDILFGDIPTLIEISSGDRLPADYCTKLRVYLAHLEANADGEGSILVCYLVCHVSCHTT